VTRDGLMTAYARLYPGYGFECHKGSANAAHLAIVSARAVVAAPSFVRTRLERGWTGATASILE
jgi:ribonuclease HII